MKAMETAKMKIVIAVFILVYSGLSFVTVEYLQQSYHRDKDAAEYQDLSQRLSLIRANIEANVNAEIFLIDSLATLITFAPNTTFPQWEEVAKQLVKKTKHIKNLGVSPNDVISFIYPLKGNERAMGLDFREHAEQWQEIERARQSQSVTISGPLILEQGGQAIIGRMPLFFDPPENTDYWGHCSVVIDIVALFADSGVNDIPNNVQLAIRGLNASGPNGAVFLGDASVFDNPLVSETINLVNGSWFMAMKLTENRQPRSLKSFLSDNIVRITGYGIALLFMLSFMFIFKAYRIAHRVSLLDVLTKLPNRRYAMLVLEQLSQARSNGGNFTVINIDLNRFKQINDTYGHSVGDAFLIEVALRLKQTLRASDTVARLGGDEFLLILPRLSSEMEINHIREKLESQVCREPFHYNEVQLEISLSLGVATYPNDASTISELLHRADQAMYLDKQARTAKARH